MKQTCTVLLSTLMVAMIISFGCNKSTDPVAPGPDPVVGATVTIGTQVWTKENLCVDKYRNGDPIPQVQDSIQWSQLTTGAWCYYNNSTANGNIYCKLYNWYAVNDSRGLAPTGWHIPNDVEWTTLTNYLGGDSIAGGKLKSTTLWSPPNTGATNSSGFTAFPGGLRLYDGSFNFIGKWGIFWSSSENTSCCSFALYLTYNSMNAIRDGNVKNIGYSVRCVRD